MSLYHTGSYLFYFCTLICFIACVFYITTLLINEFGLLFKIAGTIFMTVSFGLLFNHCDREEQHMIRMAEINKKHEEEKKNINK